MTNPQTASHAKLHQGTIERLDRLDDLAADIEGQLADLYAKLEGLAHKVNHLALSIPALGTELRGLIDALREDLDTRVAFGG